MGNTHLDIRFGYIYIYIQCTYIYILLGGSNFGHILDFIHLDINIDMHPSIILIYIYITYISDVISSSMVIQSAEKNVGIREKGRRFEAFGILLGSYEFICLTQSLGDDVWMLYLFQRYRNQNCIQLLWMILGFYFLKAPVSEDTSESLRSFPNLKN